MANRPRREIFLERLTALSEGGARLVSNHELQYSLGWTAETYQAVKQQLRSEELIIVSRGRGGLVGLAQVPDAPALTVFVSYCHADSDLKDQLLKHLEPLRKLDLVETWHDRDIRPGEEWADRISDELEAADLILLLVSIDFINSEYCYSQELARALERHEEQSAIVVPVILRSCLWTHMPFAKLQAVPTDGKPVTTFANIDEALTQVAESIRRLAELRLEE